MKGVILAAGKGSRLRPITSYIPKPLLPLCGGRAIDKVIELLTPKCDGIILLTGYMGELIERYVHSRYPFVKVIVVNDVLPGNLRTLLEAEKYLWGEDFLVTNADHVFEKSLWEYFPSGKGDIELACHRKSTREFFEDEMKVLVEGDMLVTMSKGLREYDGAYTGIARVSGYVSSKFWRTARTVLEKEGENAKVEDVFNALADKGTVKINWIDRVSFWEIDDIRDLRRAWDACKTRSL